MNHHQHHLNASRRAFLQSVVVGCACCSLGPAHAKLLDYQLAATEIGSSTWAVHGSTEYFNLDNGGNIVNVAFVEVPEGVVVIDTGPSKRYGEALLALINKTIPNKPILRVYNTHHHPDHFLGNQVFDPALIASSEGVIRNIQLEGNGFTDNMYRLVGDWMRGTAPVAPSVMLESNAEEVGGRRFSLFYLSGHTSADLAIRDDETGILFSGDLAFLLRAPTTPHAQIEQWISALKVLSNTDRELILPGHGPSDSTGESLLQTDDYLNWLASRVQDSLEQGLTMNEAMALPIPLRFSALNVVQTEYERSVVHLYPQLEQQLMPPIEVAR